MNRRPNNDYNERQMKDKRQKIIDALDNAKCAGLRFGKLLDAAGIGNKRTLTHHLYGNERQSGLLHEKPQLVIKEDKRFYLKYWYDRRRTAELGSNQIWQRLSELIFNWFREQMLIPVDSKYAEFFATHAILFYPQKTETGFIERFVPCPLEKKGAVEVKLDLLWNPFGAENNNTPSLQRVTNPQKAVLLRMIRSNPNLSKETSELIARIEAVLESSQ